MKKYLKFMNDIINYLFYLFKEILDLLHKDSFTILLNLKKCNAKIFF